MTGLAPIEAAVTGLDPAAEHVEPTRRRIRVRLGSRLVADSSRALLMIRFGPRGLPTYFVPREDVVPDALVDESRDADGQSTWTVRAGPDRALRAAWTDGHPQLSGYVTFSWRQLDWYEEDEQVRVHARSPYGRVDTLRSSRLVEIRVGGETVARSIRPLLLFETHLPTRYYLPYPDVRAEFLEASDTVTECPYKGVARYWSVRAGGLFVPDRTTRWGSTTRSARGCSPSAHCTAPRPRRCSTASACIPATASSISAVARSACSICSPSGSARRATWSGSTGRPATWRSPGRSWTPAGSPGSS